MKTDNDLYHAPPRLSDLQGVERTKALAARSKAAHDAWRAQHRPAARRSFVARVLSAVRG